MTKMIVHARRSRNKLSQKFAIQVPARSLFLCILGDSWKLIQDPQGTHFAIVFGSKFANHFSLQVSDKYAIRVQFKNDSRFTRYAFCLRFDSKFANHLFAAKSIWVSNSRFKFQKVRILPSVLGQCYKDPQMVLKMTTTKRFDWNLQKISGFVIEMNHIKSDYSQKYPFRRRW